MRLTPLALLLAGLAPATLAQTPRATTAGMQELMQKYGAAEAYAGLAKALRRYVKAHGGQGYLSQTKAILEQPTATLDFSLALTDELLAAAKKRDFDRILARSAALLDVKPKTPSTGSAAPTKLSEAIARVEAAHAACEQAFAAIPAEEQKKLDETAPSLVADFVRHIYVHKKPANKTVWKHAQSIDWAQLYRAAALLTPLMTREFMDAVRKESETFEKPQQRPPGVEGRLVYAKETKAGWVIIGAAGKNVYDLPCAFLLDLGGDDAYTAQATASSRTQRVNVVIDVKGNDTYTADTDCAQGCGRFGVALLVDHRGDDTYTAKRVAQGASLAGIGILADYRGRDTYTGDAFVQGAAAFGCGLLFDREGNDKMSAHLTSQGFAWPLSTGVLIDLAGKDERIGTGKYPSSYGTKGKFNGMCQGASVGFRTLACGGFGVLIDGGGDDVSKCGEFGHGCGYYFGTGIVRDYGGDDVVDASRYGISAGAHFGVSAVLDDKGDDVWRNPSVAAIAGNWDLTVSCFVDRRGDDRYEAGGLAIGCATITSFAAFFDLGGKDTYVCGSRQAFGRAGHAEDASRKTTCIGLFVDLGGAKDVYPKPHGEVPQNRKSHGFPIEQPQKDKPPKVIGRGVFVDR